MNPVIETVTGPAVTRSGSHLALNTSPSRNCFTFLLVFKAQSLLYHSNLGLRVMKKRRIKKRKGRGTPWHPPISCSDPTPGPHPAERDKPNAPPHLWQAARPPPFPEKPPCAWSPLSHTFSFSLSPSPPPCTHTPNYTVPPIEP